MTRHMKKNTKNKLHTDTQRHHRAANRDQSGWSQYIQRCILKRHSYNMKRCTETRWAHARTTPSPNPWSTQWPHQGQTETGPYPWPARQEARLHSFIPTPALTLGNLSHVSNGCTKPFWSNEMKKKIKKGILPRQTLWSTALKVTSQLIYLWRQLPLQLTFPWHLLKPSKSLWTWLRNNQCPQKEENRAFGTKMESSWIIFCLFYIKKQCSKLQIYEYLSLPRTKDLCWGKKKRRSEERQERSC